MSNDEINIAIAQICGWTDISRYTQAADGWYGYKPKDGPHCKIPNYTGDLNAMHEAEKVLTEEKLWDMAALLSKRILKAERAGVFFIENAANILKSTARQRAEAFLRVFGKWKEGA